MNLLGLYHRVDGIYGYQEKNGSLTVRLRIAKNEATKIEIIFGDRYNFKWNNISKKNIWLFENILDMTKTSSDELHDYYEINLKDISNENRYKYIFKIHSKNQIWIYGENILEKVENIKSEENKVYELGFSWAYSTSKKCVSAPEWWKKTNWYQIFPDRFSNGEEVWKKEKPKNHVELVGGTLRGIIQKISYIRKLGFNGIYLNPIFEAKSSHMYDTSDYFKISKSFGTIKDFKILVKTLKKHNMKLMLDGVFNHSGTNFKPWRDVLKNKEKSKYKNWFYINSMEKTKKAENYKKNEFTKDKFKPYSTFGNTPFMPRINSENKNVQKYFEKVVKFWTHLGVDAWRLDVADEPSFDFWRKFRIWVKDVNPEVAILGEIWYDSIIFLHGDQFDSTMNYPLRSLTIDYFVEQKINFEKFKNLFIKRNFEFSHLVNHSSFNLLSSHDTSRFIQECKGNINKWKTSFTWLYLNPGSTCFYYGDEYFLYEKPSTPEEMRILMNWNFDKSNPFYIHIKEILKIRNKNLDIIYSGILNLEIKNNNVIKIIYKKGFIMFSLENGNVLKNQYF